MSNWVENERRVDLPYPKESIYICVEHPALVQNDDKALQTIGGVETLAKTHSNPSQRLALRWRPDDIYCKPTYADRFPCTNILIKVKKRRHKKDGREEYKIEILGRIETNYKFKSLCDFQYLAIKKTKDGHFESFYDKVVMNDFSLERPKYFNEDVPLFVPPVLFSRVDKPCDFLYRQDIEHRQGYKNPDLSRPSNLIGTVRQRRSIFTIFVNFGESVPTEPLPQAVKKLSSDYVDKKGAEVIKQFLEEKPLWLKVELEHKTGVSSDKFKVYLPALCFYWLDGPWRGQWNKFGHDPTKDTSSKIYQTLDFRMRLLNSNMMDVKAKRSDFNVTQFNQMARNQKHNVRINIKALGDEEDEKDDDDKEREMFYKFIPGKNPPQRMMYYPLNYIEIDEVQEMVHRNDGKETSCSERDGWCFEGFQDKCRDIMYKYMNLFDLNIVNYFTKKWKKKRKTSNLLKIARTSSTAQPPARKETAMEVTDTESTSTTNIGGELLSTTKETSDGNELVTENSSTTNIDTELLSTSKDMSDGNELVTENSSTTNIDTELLSTSKDMSDGNELVIDEDGDNEIGNNEIQHEESMT